MAQGSLKPNVFRNRAKRIECEVKMHLITSRQEFAFKTNASTEHVWHSWHANEREPPLSLGDLTAQVESFGKICGIAWAESNCLLLIDWKPHFKRLGEYLL
jgi:hypothetical protein